MEAVLRVKGCTKEFKEGFGEGVLLRLPMKEILDKVKDESEVQRAMALLSVEKQLIEEYIEVIFEGG
ncbi:hypothetical protein N9937_00815 [bacterium]|nr:hypothetical protein [bacterium]